MPAPPQTGMSAPVMNWLPSPQRNSAVCAISSGVASLRSGVYIACNLRRRSGIAAVDSVSVVPGEIMLTRTPEGPSSAASERVSALSAAFAITKALHCAGGTLQVRIEPIFTMRPDFCATIPGPLPGSSCTRPAGARRALAEMSFHQVSRKGRGVTGSTGAIDQDVDGASEGLAAHFRGAGNSIAIADIGLRGNGDAAGRRDGVTDILGRGRCRSCNS